jgi:hypothetical protein
VTISPALRIVALVAVILALAAGGFVLLETLQTHRSAPNSNTQGTVAAHSHAAGAATHGAASRAAAAHAAAAHHATAAQTAAAREAAIATTLPPKLTHLLRYHTIVVAVIYAPGVLGESGVVGLARKGAREAHAGFIVFDVRNEPTAESVAVHYPGAFDPTVLILNRHGDPVTMLNGVQQSAAVAQAVLDARR